MSRAKSVAEIHNKSYRNFMRKKYIV